MDLEGLTDELELLHDLKLRVDFNYCSSDANAEVRDVFPCLILQLLNTDESGPKGIGRPIEGCVAGTEFWSVFNHSKPLSLHIICAIDWYCLKLPPAHGNDDRVFIFLDMRVPSMLLYLDTDIRICQLLVSQRLQYDWVLRHKHPAELLLYLQLDPHEHTHLVVALTLSQEEAHLLPLVLLLLLVVVPPLLLFLTILSDVL